VPTKAPMKTFTTASPDKASVTAVPTKAPVKSSPTPGTCPAGNPVCVGASDCTLHGFSHCVDGCCANIGSKSAKDTKSSKRILVSLAAIRLPLNVISRSSEFVK
jgi:hypothetical protein